MANFKSRQKNFCEIKWPLKGKLSENGQKDLPNLFFSCFDACPECHQINLVPSLLTTEVLQFSIGSY